MQDKIIESTDESLALIRNKAKEDVVRSDFRKKLIGGISEDDVEDYINMLQLQFQYKENKLNEQIEELISLKDKLRVEFNTYIEKAGREKKKLLEDLEGMQHNLEDYVNQCNTKDAHISELEKKIADFQTGFNENSNTITALSQEKLSLSKEIEAVKEKLQEERLYSATKIRELEMQNHRLSKQGDIETYNTKSANYNAELNSLYNELERVKEQVKANADLQRQLEEERQRSEKAEREISDFFKSMLELKDKLNNSGEN